MKKSYFYLVDYFSFGGYGEDLVMCISRYLWMAETLDPLEPEIQGTVSFLTLLPDLRSSARAGGFLIHDPALQPLCFPNIEFWLFIF